MTQYDITTRKAVYDSLHHYQQLLLGLFSDSPLKPASVNIDLNQFAADVGLNSDDVRRMLTSDGFLVHVESVAGQRVVTFTLPFLPAE